jgi:cytochrome c556
MRSVAWIVVMGIVLGIGTVLAEEKVPTIKEIMDKLHKGANPPIILIKRNLQSADPDWEEIQKQTKDFAEMVAALEKNDPPKGDKGSWTRLTRQYIANAKAMDAAAQKMDKRETLKAQAKLAGSCTTCHKAHRPE